MPIDQEPPAIVAPAPEASASADAGPSLPPPEPPLAPPGVTNPTPPPPGLGSKQRLSDADYARKVEGGYFTGLPLANFDRDTGFGFGARAYYYADGKREDPLFAYTPYLQRVFLQAFGTTNGAQFHWLDYDSPAFLGSLFRVRAGLIFAQNITENYYGTGAGSLKTLSFPGDDRLFAKGSEYDTAARSARPDGTTYAKYDQYFVRKISGLVSAERSLVGGVVRPLLGLGFNYATIRDYTGDMVDATDGSGGTVQARQAQTRLASDCAAQRVVGCAGGFDNVLRLGVSLDTRDFEPDPNRGVYAELSAELASRALGSDYEYARFLGSVRGFYSPFPHTTDLVLAGRALYEIQSKGTPFTSMSTIPFLDDSKMGLGGFRTLRGFRSERFVGPVIALTNFEARWTFYRFRALQQGFGLILVPFMDIGRVFDSVNDFSLKTWKRTQGGGFRIAWNEATIVMIDYGVSTEDTGLYINFNHIF